jgi:6-phosphogluconolactonase
VYGSNRGENTIAVFKRNTKNGKLDKIQSISVHGDWPRNFTLDPTGNFLLVANKNSENISVFTINTSTGKLKFSYNIKVPEPVCLLF